MDLDVGQETLMHRLAVKLIEGVIFSTIRDDEEE